MNHNTNIISTCITRWGDWITQTHQIEDDISTINESYLILDKSFKREKVQVYTKRFEWGWSVFVGINSKWIPLEGHSLCIHLFVKGFANWIIMKYENGRKNKVQSVLLHPTPKNSTAYDSYLYLLSVLKLIKRKKLRFIMKVVKV